MTIRRLFIANRGEIAVRIIRTAKRLGIETVIGVSAADRDSAGAAMADRAVVLGPAAAQKSYLNPGLILHAAVHTGCDALHPGYGFLSEKPELSRLCEQENIIFVGPRAETIEALGDKLAARAAATKAGVKTTPGSDLVASVADACEAGRTIGYPLVMKASAGGGGRGMYKAASEADLIKMFDRVSLEAESAFGDGRLFIERFVERARHIEVQAIGDGDGGVIHFAERDCTVQRRYQKLIEEAPSVALSAKKRNELHDSAVSLLAVAKYRNAGTVEFLFDVDRDEFYFMEVNSRIQVEHPVSEEVTGFDLIERQLRVAAGDGVGVVQEQVRVEGHAIECRINAEDPHNNFTPAPGRITTWRPPQGDGVRIDSHAGEGYLVPPYYDSMIGKLIVRGKDRNDAIDRMRRALAGFEIGGVKTSLPLAAFVVGHPDFRANRITTRWLEDVCLPEFYKAKG
ncbi:MAG: acetyl/propionyl/methylcrotonyl-CoA carboxylase subunit alpha [Parvularculaceae bacterium]